MDRCGIHTDVVGWLHINSPSCLSDAGGDPGLERGEVQAPLWGSGGRSLHRPHRGSLHHQPRHPLKYEARPWEAQPEEQRPPRKILQAREGCNTS